MLSASELSSSDVSQDVLKLIYHIQTADDEKKEFVIYATQHEHIRELIGEGWQFKIGKALIPKIYASAVFPKMSVEYLLVLQGCAGDEKNVIAIPAAHHPTTFFGELVFAEPTCDLIIKSNWRKEDNFPGKADYAYIYTEQETEGNWWYVSRATNKAINIKNDIILSQFLNRKRSLKKVIILNAHSIINLSYAEWLALRAHFKDSEVIELQENKILISFDQEVIADIEIQEEYVDYNAMDHIFYPAMIISNDYIDSDIILRAKEKAICEYYKALIERSVISCFLETPFFLVHQYVPQLSVQEENFLNTCYARLQVAEHNKGAHFEDIINAIDQSFEKASSQLEEMNRETRESFPSLKAFEAIAADHMPKFNFYLLQELQFHLSSSILEIFKSSVMSFCESYEPDNNQRVKILNRLFAGIIVNLMEFNPKLNLQENEIDLSSMYHILELINGIRRKLLPTSLFEQIKITLESSLTLDACNTACNKFYLELHEKLLENNLSWLIGFDEGSDRVFQFSTNVQRLYEESLLTADCSEPAKTCNNLKEERRQYLEDKFILTSDQMKNFSKLFDVYKLKISIQQQSSFFDQQLKVCKDLVATPLQEYLRINFNVYLANVTESVQAKINAICEISKDFDSGKVTETLRSELCFFSAEKSYFVQRLHLLTSWHNLLNRLQRVSICISRAKKHFLAEEQTTFVTFLMLDDQIIKICADDDDFAIKIDDFNVELEKFENSLKDIVYQRLQAACVDLRNKKNNLHDSNSIDTQYQEFSNHKASLQEKIQPYLEVFWGLDPFGKENYLSKIFKKRTYKALGANLTSLEEALEKKIDHFSESIISIVESCNGLYDDYEHALEKLKTSLECLVIYGQEFAAVESALTASSEDYNRINTQIGLLPQTDLIVLQELLNALCQLASYARQKVQCRKEGLIFALNRLDDDLQVRITCFESSMLYLESAYKLGDQFSKIATEVNRYAVQFFSENIEICEKFKDYTKIISEHDNVKLKDLNILYERAIELLEKITVHREKEMLTICDNVLNTQIDMIDIPAIDLPDEGNILFVKYIKGLINSNCVGDESLKVNIDDIKFYAQGLHQEFYEKFIQRLIDMSHFIYTDVLSNSHQKFVDNKTIAFLRWVKALLVDQQAALFLLHIQDRIDRERGFSLLFHLCCDEEDSAQKFISSDYLLHSLSNWITAMQDAFHGYFEARAGTDPSPRTEAIRALCSACEDAFLSTNKIIDCIHILNLLIDKMNEQFYLKKIGVINTKLVKVTLMEEMMKKDGDDVLKKLKSTLAVLIMTHRLHLPMVDHEPEQLTTLRL